VQAVTAPVPLGRRKRHRRAASPLPWVVRAAATLLIDGPIALLERDTDEVVAILRTAIELVTAAKRRAT
jgi:hypothetical protein